MQKTQISNKRKESDIKGMKTQTKYVDITAFINDRVRHWNFWFYVSVLLLTFLLYTIYGPHQIVTKQRPVRVLAIGDSLTRGGYNRGRNFHSYARHLKQLFNVSNIPVEIEQRGISGERVVPTMVNRLRHFLSKNASYDWIIILGGTNDIVKTNFSAMKIFSEGLEQMYIMSLNHAQSKTKLVVMTVLEIGYRSPSSKADEVRSVLNTMIRDYVAKSRQQRRISLVDLDREIPYHTVKNEQERNRTWNDAIHLTPAGYDRMGTLVFNAMKENL